MGFLLMVLVVFSLGCTSNDTSSTTTTVNLPDNTSTGKSEEIVDSSTTTTITTTTTTVKQYDSLKDELIKQHGLNVTLVERSENKWEYRDYWDCVFVSVNDESLKQTGNININQGSKILESIKSSIQKHYPESEVWVLLLHNNCQYRGIMSVDSIPDLYIGGNSEISGFKEEFNKEYC